jgi:hypothetical protein
MSGKSASVPLTFCCAAYDCIGAKVVPATTITSAIMMIVVFVFLVFFNTDNYFDEIYLRFAAYYFMLILIYVTTKVNIMSNEAIDIIQYLDSFLSKYY